GGNSFLGDSQAQKSIPRFGAQYPRMQMVEHRSIASTWPPRLHRDGDSRGGRMALTTVGKVLYSVIFVVLVPVALIEWAVATARVVHLPAIRSLPLGASLAVTGALLVLLGMRDLWVYGGGLPMNAYPPPRYVTSGTYRVLPHPIYTGFCILCVGGSILVGSSTPLRILTPPTLIT